MAAITTTTKPRYEGLKVTREEYLDLEEDGFKYDVIDGVMHMAPSPNFEHGDAQIALGFMIRGYLQKNPLGKVACEVDVFLPDGGDPLRPDISLILNENLHIVKTHIHGTPDLVCEVLSAASRERDLGVKAERYLKCGVKEYWIADPDNKTLQVWYNAKDHWEKVQGVMEFHSKLLPGLVVTTKEIFG
ncbi:MAG: Uma2 family endonuclease [Leptospiraceae bacterium]|nr:Uma2 family endonuclease [Leptospiraceae bacterium]